MILQYSSLRCISDKCWLGEDFQCERCLAVGRSGTCQPQNNADYRRTQSLQGKAQMFHASSRRKLSWNTGTVEHGYKGLCPNEPVWSPDQRTIKACWDQGYSLQWCRDFNIKEIRFLLLWALHPLLWRYFNLSSFLKWAIYPMSLRGTVQNLKPSWCGFLCSPLILFHSECKGRGFFFFIYFSFPRYCGMIIFYFTVLATTLEYASLLPLKKNPVSCISNKVIWWQ